MKQEKVQRFFKKGFEQFIYIMRINIMIEFLTLLIILFTAIPFINYKWVVSILTFFRLQMAALAFMLSLFCIYDEAFFYAYINLFLTKVMIKSLVLDQ